ncbi:hypothetical protein ADM98_00795 [Exiguobacterium sp. BMC-KP]|uniref:hypothetical protein n=1 Tax=Exiguobacterium sp. BMC-KP TaxID=1684312 RepID=UPI0006AA2525|nr:hypothetical protein [Exiguobacterium sp. BMC-KP]KOP31418.1 hypothetical protein ADM98_00795 [Exiguobacterium sp. BMC-KP]
MLTDLEPILLPRGDGEAVRLSSIAKEVVHCPYVRIAEEGPVLGREGLLLLDAPLLLPTTHLFPTSALVGREMEGLSRPFP